MDAIKEYAGDEYYKKLVSGIIKEALRKEYSAELKGSQFDMCFDDGSGTRCRVVLLFEHGKVCRVECWRQGVGKYFDEGKFVIENYSKEEPRVCMVKALEYAREFLGRYLRPKYP